MLGHISLHIATSMPLTDVEVEARSILLGYSWGRAWPRPWYDSIAATLPQGP